LNESSAILEYNRRDVPVQATFFSTLQIPSARLCQDTRHDRHRERSAAPWNYELGSSLQEGNNRISHHTIAETKKALHINDEELEEKRTHLD